MAKDASGRAADTSPRLRIGELARLSGLSAHTIRWYEAQRLLPGAARDAAGRRLFSQTHVEWLALLQRLRGSGMSIRDMQAYAKLVRQGKPTLRECRQLLQAHRLKVQERLEDLHRALALLDHKLAAYDKWIART